VARYLLDTDAVIDLLYDIPSSVELVRRLFASGDTRCTCDAVVAEIFAGVRPGDQAPAEQLLPSLEYLPTPMEAARQAGAWRYGYVRQGFTFSLTSCLIAAVARIHSASLVTGNTRDFPMTELTVVPLSRQGRRTSEG